MFLTKVVNLVEIQFLLGELIRLRLMIDNSENIGILEQNFGNANTVVNPDKIPKPKLDNTEFITHEFVHNPENMI